MSMRIKLTATSVAASNKIKWKRLEYLTQVFFCLLLRSALG